MKDEKKIWRVQCFKKRTEKVIGTVSYYLEATSREMKDHIRKRDYIKMSIFNSDLNMYIHKKDSTKTLRAHVIRIKKITQLYENSST